MFTKRICSICLAMLLIAAGSASAISITTAVGNGADTALENDAQSGNHGPTSLHGTEASLTVRRYDGTRQKMLYMRFDLSVLGGHLAQAILTLNMTTTTNRARVWAIYGLIDETGDNWDEATICYNNAPGMLPAAIASYAIDPTKLRRLCTINAGATSAVISSAVDPNMENFLAGDTNGLVTFLIIPNTTDSTATWYVSSKEATTLAPELAPTLTGEVVNATRASKPNPSDKATDVARDVILSWTPPAFPSTHTVYFGTSFDDVNAGSTNVRVAQGQDANSYDPVGSLAFGQTYYWRIDEVNASPDVTLHKGGVWSFTTELVAYPITGVTALASSFDTGKGPENTTNKSGLDAAGLLHGTTDTAMWLSSKTGAQPTWIQYTFDRVYKLTDLWVWNYNNDYELLLGMGIKNAKIEYSADGTNWTTLGNFDFAQAPAASGYAHNTTVSFGGVAAKSVKITVNSGWGTSGQYGLSEVRFFYIPVLPQSPQPANNAIGVAPDVTLSWRAGREAVSHNIYMGTDPNVLTLAGTATTTSFALANLSLGTKYYWRVDEVNTAQAISTWAGDVWNFTTSPFITVDDMENYNDTTNQIFNVWVDGYGTTNNGAVVGLTTSVNGTFGSTTIFHGGKQSMPYAYTNTGSITNSEATRTFDSIQDWTKNGVKTLTLYFYGQAGNTTTIPFWVRLTDQSGKTAKVVFGAAGEDVLVLADPAWATWNIPLSSFTGITLSKIKSMTIGVGTGTGSGTLYIDDVRLYPATITTVVTSTLVGWWKMDNDVKDSSSAGNNGTIIGTPTFVAAGKIGASLKLNGTTDYVDCGNAASLNITDAVTCSAWIKPSSLANSAYQTFISKGDNAYVLAQTNANLLQMSIYDTGAWYQANSVAVTTTINGAWHHVAGTFDGTQIRLYIDGKMASSTLHTGSLNVDTYVLSLGRNSQQTGRLFTGEMDDVRVYHGALSTFDIVKLANP